MTIQFPYGRVFGLVTLASVALSMVVIGGTTEKLPPELVERLNHADYQQRVTAQAALLEWSLARPEVARDQLHKLLLEAPHPEQRLRCLGILRDLHAAAYGKDGKGFIGITMGEVEITVPGRPGLQPAIRVSLILPGHAAQKAGMQVGDCIVSINGKWLERPEGEQPQEIIGPGMTPTLDAFRAEVSDMKPGAVVKLGVLRQGKIERLDVTLGRRPVAADNGTFPLSPQLAEEAEKAAMEEDFQRWLKQSGSKGG